MSFYQFAEATEGWLDAHQSPERISEAEADEVWDWMQEQPKVPLTLAAARAARKANGGA